MTEINRMYNVGNPAQGEMKKILCVCSAGLLRSPTLAFVLSNEGYNTRSVGASPGYALIPLDAVHIKWADEIVFVNNENYIEACAYFQEILDESNVTVLKIPDMYVYRDPQLMKICLDQYNNANKENKK